MNVADSPFLYYGTWQELKFHWIGVEIKEKVRQPSMWISSITCMSIELHSKHCSQVGVRDSRCDVVSQWRPFILHWRINGHGLMLVMGLFYTDDKRPKHDRWQTVISGHSLPYFLHQWRMGDSLMAVCTIALTQIGYDCYGHQRNLQLWAQTMKN